VDEGELQSGSKEAAMIDTAMNKPVRVRDSNVGPYIMLSVAALDAVQTVLTQNGIPYWTAHTRVSVDGSPMIATIYVDRKRNAEDVQKILDQVG
jgi:hypothetical protein